MSLITDAFQHYAPFRDQPTKYESLQESDLETDLPPKFQFLGAVARLKLFSFLGGLFAAFLVFLLSALVISISTPNLKTAAQIEAEEWNHCGRSSKVAMERGCVMEPLFYGWMPPQCSWKEFSDRWPVFDDRTWYSDGNMTVPIPNLDLWAGKHIHIYTSKYHGEHCLFQWRKLQYAMDQRREFLDNKTISVHHTSHCADHLTQGCEGPDDRNDVELGFYRCRKTIW